MPCAGLCWALIASFPTKNHGGKRCDRVAKRGQQTAKGGSNSCGRQVFAPIATMHMAFHKPPKRGVWGLGLRV